MDTTRVYCKDCGIEYGTWGVDNQNFPWATCPYCFGRNIAEVNITDGVVILGHIIR